MITEIFSDNRYYLSTRLIFVDTLLTPFPKGSSMITTNQQYRKPSTATSYSSFRTPLIKSPVDYEKRKQMHFEKKNCSGGFLVVAESTEAFLNTQMDKAVNYGLN